MSSNLAHLLLALALAACRAEQRPAPAMPASHGGEHLEPPTDSRSTPGDPDEDGVPDGVDQCPDMPEDHDAFMDEDGCPDPDNDMDRIPDRDDKCPNEPETYDGHADEDGCPG